MKTVEKIPMSFRGMTLKTYNIVIISDAVIVLLFLLLWLISKDSSFLYSGLGLFSSITTLVLCTTQIDGHVTVTTIIDE